MRDGGALLPCPADTLHSPPGCRRDAIQSISGLRIGSETGSETIPAVFNAGRPLASHWMRMSDVRHQGNNGLSGQLTWARSFRYLGAGQAQADSKKLLRCPRQNARMSAFDIYMARVAECVQKSNVAHSDDEKQSWLALADSWLVTAQLQQTEAAGTTTSHRPSARAKANFLVGPSKLLRQRWAAAYASLISPHQEPQAAQVTSGSKATLATTKTAWPDRVLRELLALRARR